jgi:predicted nucleic acid-binding protein
MSNIAVVDTCVLFSSSLRDTLLRIAQTKLYDIRFTDEILEELRRNLTKKRNKSEQQIENLFSAIRGSFSKHFVRDYQGLIDLMPINKKDRHVLAAAVACKAQIIVTNNLKDFPPHLLAPFNVKAQSPDTFLLDLLANDDEEIIKTILIQQSKKLYNPPLTVSEILDRLALEAPQFVRVARELF